MMQRDDFSSLWNTEETCMFRFQGIRVKAFRITLKKHFELLRYITFADWLKNFLFHVQAENNQAAAGSLFSYNMHRHMERHTHTHTKNSTHSWSWIILLWIQFSKWKLSKEDTTLQLNQQDSASKLCVSVFVSVVVSDFVALQLRREFDCWYAHCSPRQDNCVSECMCLFVCMSHWCWEEVAFGWAGSDLYLKRDEAELVTRLTDTVLVCVLSKELFHREAMHGRTTKQCQQ